MIETHTHTRHCMGIGHHRATIGPSYGAPSCMHARASSTPHKQVFICEQLVYDKPALDKHNKVGDDTGPLAESGFKGHPPCNFCRKRFYDASELYRHMVSGSVGRLAGCSCLPACLACKVCFTTPFAFKHTLNHSLTHSRTHSLTHSLNLRLVAWRTHLGHFAGLSVLPPSFNPPARMSVCHSRSRSTSTASCAAASTPTSTSTTTTTASWKVRGTWLGEGRHVCIHTEGLGD